MINKINSLYARPIQKTSFKGRDISKNDINVRNYIRERLESNFDATYGYANQMDSLSAEQMKNRLLRQANSKRYKENLENSTKHEGPRVDFEELKKITGKPSFYIASKKDHKLYTGPRLNKYPDGIKKAAKAEIKTVISLEPLSFGYDEKSVEEAHKAGVELISIKELGNKTLTTFSVIPTYSIDAPILKKLFSHPEYWATKDENNEILPHSDKEILDAQEFINILNGENEKYPYPIYYGCDFGTNRTYSWSSFYDILKNCDQTKPLDEESIEKLVMLYKDLEEVFRY